MRPWFLICACIAALVGLGCDGEGDDDDDSASTDDDDDSATDDDDDFPDEYERPDEDGLGVAFDWTDEYKSNGIDGVRTLSDECLYYTLPSFTKSQLDLMVELTEQYGDGDCPTVTMSGPPDEVLTEVVGDCTTSDGTQFAGGYTMLDTDAGSFHIYTYDAYLYYIRPQGRQDVDSDEYFFHGVVSWSYNGDDLVGTMGVGLGELDIVAEDYADPQQGGWEAHYIGAAPGFPEWNHTYIRGMSYAELTAQQEIDYMVDMYVTSNGFYTFTSSGMFTSDPEECDREPLTGSQSVIGQPLSIIYVADGETSCNGTINVNAGGMYDFGTFSDDIW